MTFASRASALFVLAAAVAPLAAAPASADDILRTATVKGSFADARGFLQDAIVNQGLKIDYNGKIGDMLKRTGADV